MTAYPLQASIDRSARLVHRMRLRTGDTTVGPRVQTLVEEALRLTTLPGEDQGRIYVFRRLRLPALDVRDPSSAKWISRCATHLLAMSGTAAHAADPRAASAEAVFFNSIHEPWRQLAVRLIAGDAAREWFWPDATSPPRDLPSAIRLEQTLDRWRVQADGWALVARELMPALDAPAARAFVGLLRPSACERWLGGLGRHTTIASNAPVPRVREREGDVLHRVRLEVGHGDRRLLFLAVLAILDSSPSAPQDATLPLLAARVLDAPVGRARVVRDARGRLSGPRPAIDEPAAAPPEETRDRAAPAIAPADISPDASPTPDSTREAEHRTEYAGLYFLLQPLRRLGIVRVIEAHPELALTHFVERVLLELSVQAGVPGDDSILQPLVDDLNASDVERCRAALPASARERIERASARLAEAPEARRRLGCIDGRPKGLRYRDSRLWVRAVRMWCRKYARMTLNEIVARAGRVYATPTSIDVTMPMSAVDVRIRRSGLDIDPGYVPWFGRVVHFHYHLEG